MPNRTPGGVPTTTDRITLIKAAGLLNLTRPAFAKWVERGTITGTKIGRNVFVSRAEVLALSEALESADGAEGRRVVLTLWRHDKQQAAANPKVPAA